MKQFVQNNRVLQKRTKSGGFIFDDPDITLTIGINQVNRETVGNLIIKTDVPQTNIGGTFFYGQNNEKLKTATGSTYTKNLNINQDDNGSGNGSNAEIIKALIYLSDARTVKEIELAQSASGIQYVGFVFSEHFTSLNSLRFMVRVSSIDFSFLNNNPNIQKITFNTWVLGTVTGLSYLKNSNLKYMEMNGYSPSAPYGQIVQNLPDNFIYFRVSQWETQTLHIEQYYTGSRHCIFVGGYDLNKIYYNGGALFPSIIQDAPNMESPCVFNFSLKTIRPDNVNPTNARNLTPFENARLLVDFANQVEQVILQNPASKKITLFQSSDTTYVDNSQPKFKTFPAALAHINSTLGVTVTYLQS